MDRTRRIVALALAGVLSLAVVSLAGAETDMPLALGPTAAAPLEGTTWRLREYLRGDTQRQAGPEVAAWMQLRDGRLRGSGGCTRLRGRYASMGGALQIALGKARKPDCAQSAVMVQRAMMANLQDARGYRIISGDIVTDTRLLIIDASGDDVLGFDVDDASPLSGGEWRLESYLVEGDRRIADPSQPAVLSFQTGGARARERRADGELVGSTGCNGVVGEYRRQADVLSVASIETTDAPCGSSLGIQESAMLDVLRADAMLMRLPPDRLILSADDGGELEFVSDRPLEGSTWLLRTLGRGNAPASTVTLRLRSGRATGEGACGPYAGTYATDGLFITVLALAGADRDDCEESAADRRYLDALRRAVLVDRGRGDLRLRDAAGRDVVRFVVAGLP